MGVRRQPSMDRSSSPDSDLKTRLKITTTLSNAVPHILIDFTMHMHTDSRNSIRAGRLPVRVNLAALTEKDLLRILVTHLPTNTRHYGYCINRYCMATQSLAYVLVSV